MPIQMNVESRFDVAAAEAAARQAKSLFGKAAEDISKSWGGTMSSMFNRLDGTEARGALRRLQDEYAATARAAEDAAAVQSRAAGIAEAAAKREAEATKLATDAALRYADAQRAAADAGVLTATQARELEGLRAKAVATDVAATKAAASSSDAAAKAAAASRDHSDAVAAAAVAQSNMGTAVDETSSKMGGFTRVLNGVGVASTAAFAGIGFMTTKAAGDFQQGLEKLTASAGLPADQLKTVSDGILAMTGKVGYSADELNAAMFTITKSGYSAADGLKVLQAAAQGANAEQAPLPEVVNALTTSLHDFGVPADQAAKVMSQMVTAVGESKAPLGDFANALHTIEPGAQAAKISLADLWGTLAQVTQSGTSPDQAADQINNAMRSLSNIQGPARDALQQLGIDAQDVTDKLGDGPGGRGLAGTMQYLSDQVLTHLADQNHINVGELKQNAQAAENAKEAIGAMGPEAAKASQAYADGALGSREYTMAIRGATDADKQKMQQFQHLQDSVNGFSKNFANGRSTLQTYNQTMNQLTGTTSGAAIAFQTTGVNAGETNDRIAAINKTTSETDGTVKGFNETQETLNAKMRDSKAAFGAAAIELGNAFVPVMTDVANVAKDVGDFMAEHKTIAEGTVYALGGIATAWVGIKAAMVAKDGWDLVKGGYQFMSQTALPTMARLNSAWADQGASATASAAEVEAAAAAEATAEDGVATSAAAANTALGGAGAAAEGGVGGVAAAGAAEGGAVDAVAAAATAASAGLGGIVTTLGAVVAPLTAIVGLVTALDQDPSTNPGAVTAGNHALARRFGGDAPPTAPHNSFTGTPFAPPAVTDDLPPTVKPQPWSPPGLVVVPGPAGANLPGAGGGAPAATWGNQGPVPYLPQSPLLTPYAHADGGIDGPLPSSATIQPGSGRGLIQWAEGSTGGEAYIPIDGGDRSKKIWAQTGHLLGVFDQGGFNGTDMSSPDVLGDYGPDVQAAAQLVGTQYSNALRNDCSGMVGQVVNDALGIASSNLPTTQDMGQFLAERGFQPGIGGPGDISVGWYNHGSGIQDGHAAMTLSDGENAEQGGSHNQFIVGPGAAGASSAEFDQHMYLPGASGGGGLFVDQKKVSDLEERIRRKDQDIQVLEEHQGELKDNAKKSERDRLQNEIDNAKRDLSKMQGELNDAERGSYRPGSRGSRGGRGSRGSSSGSGSFGAPLPANFGLGKGLPGMAEWGVDALMDIAAAPALAQLGAISNAAGATGPGGTTGLFGMMMAQRAADGGGGGIGLASALGPSPLGGGRGPGIPGVPGGDVTGYQGTAAPVGIMGTPHQNTGTGKGIGMSGGGILGAAMSAGGGAANMFAPGAGVAAQVAMQEISRGIQFGGQVAGELGEGFLQTFLPDAPMNGPLGKLLGGVVGAHPVMQDTADQAQQGQNGYQAQQQPDSGGGGGGANGAPGQGGKTGASPGPMQPGQGNTDNSQTSGDTVHGNQINGDVNITQGGGQPDPSGMLGFQSQAASLTP